MNNLNDMEKFDSVFRSAVTDYELPYDENAWALMQQKLDSALGKKKRRGIWWWFPVVFIAIGAGIYVYTKESKNVIATDIIATSTNKNIDTKEPAANDINKNTTTENVNKNNNYNTTASEIKESISSETKKETSINKNKTLANKQNNTSTLKENISIKNSATNTINTKQRNVTKSNNSSALIPKNTDVVANQVSTNDKQVTAHNAATIDNTLKSISNVSGINMYTANILYMHNRYIPNFKQLEKDNIVIAAKREEEHKKIIEEEKRPMIRPIVPGLPTSSDWFLTAYLGNNIGYVSNPEIKNSHLQYQFGVGYNFSRNVSLQTGVAFGKRTFDMRKDQFTYKGPGAFEKYIKNINGDVSIIDIPVTLRYQLSDKENFGWFATIGISTVFSKRENYIVTIDNGSTVTYLHQNFENTPSWMSMLNLSVGYQYPLSKKVTLTVEPYLQLPFKVIGEGGSKLSSVGLQIGAKYNLPKRKK